MCARAVVRGCGEVQKLPVSIESRKARIAQAVGGLRTLPVLYAV
jgi:hypothetical protein